VLTSPGGTRGRPKGRESMAVMGPPNSEWDSVRGGSGRQKMLIRATDGQQVEVVSDTKMCCVPSVAQVYKSQNSLLLINV